MENNYPRRTRRKCFSSGPQVPVIALFHCTDYSLPVRTGRFLLGKDKLTNLKHTVFFILPRSRAIFQKFEGKSVENNWN